MQRCFVLMLAAALLSSAASRLLLDGDSTASAGNNCTDLPPHTFTCAEQQAWGKCESDFMVGRCDATCGRCSPTSPPAAFSAPPSPRDRSALAIASVKSSSGAPANTSSSPYATVLGLSYQFYDAQRSGHLPKPFPISWRGDSHTNDTVPGGFHDAGDHLKLNFPLATSATFLAWGLLEFLSGYQAAGQTAAAHGTLRWAADYLMGCHTAPGSYIGQIGDPGVDHAYWGRPEDQTGPRPAFTWDAQHPGSDLAGAAASALASISLALRPSDPTYADKCLAHARDLFTLASSHEGKYSDAYPAATYVYMSSSFLDDLAFAAGWLYRATNESSYLTSARQYLQRSQYQRNYYVNWDSVYSAADALLLCLGVGPSEGLDLQWQFNMFLQTWQKGQNGVSFSQGGLAVAPLGGWGNLRHSANAAFIMLVHAKATNDSSVRAASVAWARKQIDYMLGSSGRSFVVGYGVSPPTHVHHRAASCPDAPQPCSYNVNFNSPAPNPHVLTGALVGGPPDTNDASYQDRRDNFQTNEVAFDYNAGFTGALAGLTELLSAAA